ncbi:beta-lactamase class A [Pedobacter antarcticus]|nr:beta-lactamase class A [Pedobacter antarcticus]
MRPKNMIFFKKMAFCALFMSIANSGFAQHNVLRQKAEELVKSKPAAIGFSIINLKTGDTLSVNGEKHLPMQSVYKFHLALAVLKQVDQNKFTLDQKILVKKKDLLPNTWSPLRDKYPGGNIKLPLSEILFYTVAQSDNNGCDILFRLLGGPEIVNKYIHSLGIKDVEIRSTEEQMHADDQLQFKNWTTANAATQLLKRFYMGQLLKQPTNDFLMKIMAGTTTGTGKLKGKLPTGTEVAHKTGYSGQNEAGIIAATNDIGIITLPDGTHFAIAIFVSMTALDEKASDQIIAELAKLSWDEFAS